MRYLLAILTCGRPAYLTRTLAAYGRFLDPAPAEIFAYDDGGNTPLEAFDVPGWEGVPIHVQSAPVLLGRCRAHAQLWEATRRPEYADLDWVFTVEDDILLLRPLDLYALAELLHVEPKLEQVALVRAPWHPAEIELGGFIPLFEDRYERRRTVHPRNGDSFEWVASQWDWTSSPALLPMSLPREIDWPEANCERELGPRIMALRPDAVSGYWGWGEPWVSHIGLERIPGALG